MLPDENFAYNIIEKLSFPRLVGTSGNKKAVDIICKVFEDAGYDTTKRESFKTDFFDWAMARYIFFPLGISLILIALSFFKSPFLTFFILGVVTLLAVNYRGILKTLKTRYLKNENNIYETENIYAELKCKSPKAKVIFMAHYDTKSQTFSSIFRIIIMLTAVFGLISLYFLFLVLTLIKLFFVFNFPLLNVVLLLLSIIIAMIGFLNYFNKTGNESCGSYDNASGVATIIALAKYFKANPIEHLDFIFLATGSEEINLKGAKDFIKKHKDHLDKKTTYIINLDSVGASGPLKLITRFGIPPKYTSKEIDQLFMESAKELNLDVKELYLPIGAWADNMPFVKKKYKASWIISPGALKYVHTKRDDMSIISKPKLKDMLQLCLEVVKKIRRELA